MPDPDYYSDTTESGSIRTGKYRDLSVGAGATDKITQAMLDNAALWAYARMNSRLAKSYSVPFDTADPPDAIREISDMLTVAQVKAASGGHSVRSKGPWSDLFKDADEWLDRLVSGKDTLPEVTRRPSGLSSSTEGEHQVFGNVNDDFEYGQDPDQAERIADERD